jgi:hypothetical protein
VRSFCVRSFCDVRPFSLVRSFWVRSFLVRSFCDVRPFWDVRSFWDVNLEPF